MPHSNANGDKGKGRGKPGNLSDAERAAFERRVAELDRKLDKVVSPRERAERSDRGRSRSRGMAYGLRMGSELVAAVLVGGLMGYGLDYLLGTGPWLFMIFFMLGFAAGIMNLLRAYKNMQSDIDAETGGDLGQDMPDDSDDDER